MYWPWLDAQDEVIQDRDREIKHIQGQMRDVNDIFKSLAQLVEEQSEIVGTIFFSSIFLISNTFFFTCFFVAFFHILPSSYIRIVF